MDPGSGTSGVYETARALGALAKQGWTPERSIVFAFWDAEEPGLVGSTEYAEAFEKELRQKAVAYINTDLFMQGHFFGGGTPSLRDFLVQVTEDVPAVSGHGTVHDEWPKGPKNSEVELAALGSGADFVAFQDYLGLPTLSVQYDFEGSYGPYHSNYDSRYYVEHFSDPGFHVARTLAQVFGVSVMRLADAAVLPYRYSHYAHKISEFLDDASTWGAVKLDLDRSKALAAEIAKRSEALERRIDENVERGRWPDTSTAALNDHLTHLEQDLLDESGSPAEHWYRHVIYGWNIYSLYDGQPLPGLAEAIRLNDPARVAQETARIENALAPHASGTASGRRLIGKTLGKYHETGALSRELYERALRVMPGGNTRHSVALAPYPIYARSGSGCRITDVEGEERVDFLNNYTSLILGHAHPEVTEAVQRRAALGTAFTMPTPEEVDLAELITGRVSYVEHIRFCNSGSEAVMLAVKAARAFTGRHKIAKFEGAYHGIYDYVQVSEGPTPDVWGEADAPASITEPGTPDSVARDVVVLPWNHAGRLPQTDRAAQERSCRAAGGPDALGNRHDCAAAGISGVAARRNGTARNSSDRRRGSEFPPGLSRRFSRPRHHAGPDDFRKDHRRRISGGWRRRIAPRHVGLRPHRCAQSASWRNLQRQSGHHRGGPGNHAADDSGSFCAAQWSRRVRSRPPAPFVPRYRQIRASTAAPDRCSSRILPPQNWSISDRCAASREPARSIQNCVINCSNMALSCPPEAFLVVYRHLWASPSWTDSWKHWAAR